MTTIFEFQTSDVSRGLDDVGLGREGSPSWGASRDNVRSEN